MTVREFTVVETMLGTAMEKLRVPEAMLEK